MGTGDALGCGDGVGVAGETPVSIAALKNGFESWFPAYMSGKAS